MANSTLQSFNVFLTERLTAAAVDIYGFVEKTIMDYQEEVYHTKLENQRLQRLLDLVYKPEIRLHRADSRQIALPTPKQEVCAREQQIQKECIPSEADKEQVILTIKEELAELCTRSVETPVLPACSNVTGTLTQNVTVGEHEENEMPDSPTQVVTVGEHGGYEAPESPSRVLTVGEHVNYEIPSPDDQPLPSAGVSPASTKKKKHLPQPTNQAFTCSACGRKTDTRSQMICHMRTHTGEKPFACPVCGNRYRLRSHIKEHMRTHTGERPYTCHVCGKSFNRSSNMTKHAWVKHGENMPFKCMQCSQRFPLLVVFKHHMKAVHDVTFSV